MVSAANSSRRTRKIAAIAAGILVVGVAATYTLASWTDSEWVWGGAAGDPGVGTSSFNVEQDTTLTFANNGWTDEETNPGGGLMFSTNALSLTPGDTTYAPVALRSAQGSVAGTVTLQAAVPAAGVTVSDPGNSLWDAVTVQVYTQNTATSPFDRVGTCDAAVAASADWTLVAGVNDLGTVATADQVLAASSGDVQHYCFAVALPAGSPDTLQGRTIAPAWEFKAVSN